MSARRYHPFVACHSRLNHQLRRMRDFLQRFSPSIKASEDRDIVQFTMEMATVATHAFADEYFRCLLLIAAVHRENLARAILQEEGSDDERRILSAGCDAAGIVNMMQSRVRFGRKRGRALRRVFERMLEFGAFPDDKSAELLADLAKVRHLIVHDGAWPEEKHASDIAFPGVIVMTNAITLRQADEEAEHRFYQLDLVGNLFVLSVLMALGETLAHHEREIEKHPRWGR